MLYAMLLATALGTAVNAPITVRLDDLGVVSTMIDGKGPYHFVLDTGAGITVITPEFARRASLTGSGNQQATGSGGTVAVQSLTLREVSVGGTNVSNVAAAIIPLPLDVTYQGRYGTIDGILGYSFLSHFAVTIDIEKHLATFSPPGSYETPAAATSVTADLGDNTPIVDATADGISGPFKLDTGDDGDITLTQAFVAAHHFKASYPNGQPAMFEGVGGFDRAIDVRLRSFSLAGSFLPNQITTLSLATTGIFGGTTLAGNIGDGVLKRFIFTVDYPRRRVDFTPNDDLTTYEPYERTGLLATRQADGTLRVIAILPQSPGSQSGVRVGDVLVALNGVPLANLDRVQMHQAVLAKTVTYTVQSGSSERNVTLVLRDLLPLSQLK